MICWRVKTEYSFGATYAPLSKIIERLNALGCKAAAITDRGGTWGHVPFYKAAQAAGIQPLLGVELAIEDGRYMVFIARSSIGLRELYKNVTLAHLQALPTPRGSVPRLYKADVMTMSGEIMKLAGDILDGDFLADIGAIIDFSPASQVLNLSKQSIAVEYNLRTIECCDNAYVSEGDKQLLEITAPIAAKPSAQHLFDTGDRNYDLVPEPFELQRAPMISVKDAQRKLWRLCRAGIKYRTKLNKLQWTEKYEHRLKREMNLIREKNFASYFIIVSDMTCYAKQHMLVGPSRGSAAGSLVCYLTRITEIDPLPPGLIFERFIDSTREDLPDIDLDFPDAKRYMVFDYMAQKYGKENVAHIGTITRYKAKSALAQTCKKMGIPSAATAPVKIVMIERSSADARVSDCLLDTLEGTEPGKKFLQMYPEAKIAAEIEGHASHTGVHAAGLLICNEPITNYCTVTNDGIAQIEKYSAEDLGLLKIDVLGLRTLTVLEGADVLKNEDWYALPLNDPDTFSIFDEQALSGIFQFEGDAMRQICKQMVPFKTIAEVDAVTALARPGPFASGITQQYLESRNTGKKVKTNPLVAKYMVETEGLPIYQEQTLVIVREIGKFSWADSARIRRLISRRMGDEHFQTFENKFMRGAAENGLSEEDAREIWNSINTMGSWQMNKAHTYSYAVLSYWCAWLKAHHPEAFVLSCLRSSMNSDNAIKLIREMVVAGRIKHTPFDWHSAAADWSMQNGCLMPGFNSAKGFGSVLAEKFVAARAAGALTEAMIKKIESAEKEFDDLFPVENNYGSYYNGEESVAGDVIRLEQLDELPLGTFENPVMYTFIGELIQKNLRDSNEDINIKKRGGTVLTGPVIYLDIRLRDDTGQLLTRISRHDYKRMGEEIQNKIELGTMLMIRARFIGYKFGFIKKWKCISVQ